jgi:SAM-dependent methyltransferase
MPQSIVDRVYPELRLMGFTRVDGTVQFLSRVHSLMAVGNILDIGCGRGHAIEDPCAYRRDLRRLKATGRHVIGIDVDVQGATNLLIDEYRQITDTKRWPVEDSSVQLAYSDYVLEHVEDPAGFFQEAYRVLQPGGYLCIRTPNFFGYAAFITWLIPNKLHARILRRVQPGRKDEDVFPTVYRCNSKRKLRRALERAGLEAVVYAIEGEPPYLETFPLGYRVAAKLLPHLPSVFKSTLFAFAQKPETKNSLT